MLEIPESSPIERSTDGTASSTAVADAVWISPQIVSTASNSARVIVTARNGDEDDDDVLLIDAIAMAAAPGDGFSQTD